jgi:ABC-2 type transport system permease protein
VRNIAAVFKRELRSYFNSPIAYISLTVFTALTNWLFFRNFFLIGQATLRGYFGTLPWVFLFFVPAVTMRLWAEERKMGTLELLLTLPVRDYQVVMGKFMASYAFLLLALLLSLTLPFTVSLLGRLDPGPVVGGYVGATLLGGAYLAIGLFASGLTKNQIVAFIVGVSASFLLFIVGEDFVASALPASIVPIFAYLGLGAHFESLGRGVIDSSDLVYYLSVIALFLFLNIRSIESRGWR